MNTYQIEVTETLSKVIEIKGTDELDALNTARNLYDAEAIILDSNDIQGDPQFKIFNN